MLHTAKFKITQFFCDYITLNQSRIQVYFKMYEKCLVRRKTLKIVNLEKSLGNFYYLFGQQMKPSKSVTENANRSENEKRSYT